MMRGLERGCRATACLLALISTCTLIAGPARADTYDATLTRAIAAKERALEVNDPEHWEAALRLFLELDAIRATREAKYELGFAAERMRQYDLAVESYHAALDLGLVGPPRERAESFLSEHAAHMARVLVRGAAGIRLDVGGFPRGTLPLARPLAVFGGTTQLGLGLGQCRVERNIEVVAGAYALVDVEPPACEAPTFAAPATPSAARAPVVDAVIRPTAPELAPATPVRDDASGSQALGVALLGSGAGLAVVGAVMLPIANSKAASAREDLRSSCTVLADDGDSCTEAAPGRQRDAQDAVDAVATWNNIGVAAGVGVGVGALVALSGAIVLWTSAPARPSTARALDTAPQLTLSASGAVVAARLRF